MEFIKFTGFDLIASRKLAIEVDMGNDVVKEMIDVIWPDSDQVFAPPTFLKIKVLVANAEDHKKWQYGDKWILKCIKLDPAIPTIKLSDLVEYKKMYGPNPPAGILKL